MSCSSFLSACLEDLTALEDASCTEATQLRYLAMAKLKELSCGCMSSPVEIEGTKFLNPVEAMDSLRRIVQFTYYVCEKSAEHEGPVMETIYQDRCGGVASPCRDACGPYWEEYHRPDCAD